MPTSTERHNELPRSAELRIAEAVELRKSQSGGRVLFGYAAVFDSLSEDLGGFREVIRPGAFSQSLAENPDVSARIQHEGGLSTIGRTTSGSLRIGEDDTGLWYEVDLPPTTAGNDIAALVERGDIDKSSFAFTLRDDGETEPQRWYFDQDPALRELFNLNLHDVAPVDGPAYQATSVSIRDGAKDVLTAAEVEEQRRIEREVREHAEKMHRIRWGIDTEAEVV